MIKKIIDGFPMFLNPNDAGISVALSRKGSREPCFMWILRREAKGGLAIDIGANIGYTTLSLCKNADQIIAIEPDKRSRKLLKKNIELNNFNNKTDIYDFAVSDSSGKHTIYLTDQPNLTSLHRPQKGSFSETIVKTRTIDSLDVLPNFIKMDIEGHEVEALSGAMHSLKRTPHCKILIEVHPMFYSKERNFEKVLRKLVDIGYGIVYVVSAGVPIPDLFKEHGYNPIPGAPIGRRAVYNDVSLEHAILWSSKEIKQKCPGGKTSPKIIRAIMLEK